MKNIATIIFLSFLLSGICAAQAAAPATYYVSPTGSDSNPGTLAAPFQTIQYVANMVKPGDTVIVRDGLYTLQNTNGVVGDLSFGGTATAWVTFKSEHQWGAILDGNGTTMWVGFGLEPNVSYVKIHGFTMRGFGSAGSAGGSSGVSLWGTNSNIELSGNNIYNIGNVCTNSAYGQTGIYAGPGSSSVLIENNIIHDIGRFAPGENGCQPTNTSYESHDHGVYLEGVNGATVVNNIFYNNDRGWDIQFYGDYGPNLTSNILVANNTFASHNPYKPGQIILSYPGVTDTTIENNIFYSPPTAAVLVDPNDPTSTFSNVNVTNNMVYAGTISSGSAPGITFTSNIQNTDPNFYNASAYDFHLRNPSSASGAGINLYSSFTTDIDGNPRAASGAWDMGAYVAIPMGDANSDGEVTIYDAELTAQYVIGLPVANFNVAAAEVDGTGAMDMDDTSLIAQYAADRY